MAVSHVDPDIEVVLPALKQLQKGRKRALSGFFSLFVKLITQKQYAVLVRRKCLVDASLLNLLNSSKPPDCDCCLG